MATDGQLPDGWTTGLQSVIIYEWRCPLGFSGNCNKGHKLMYKKNTKEEAEKAGAWHLIDREKHSEEEIADWAEALVKSVEGVTESSRDYEAFFDASGVEMDGPSVEKGKWGKGYKGGGQQRQQGKGKGWSAGGGSSNQPRSPLHPPRGRSRSRRRRSPSRGQSRDRRSSEMTSEAIVPFRQQQQQQPRPHEVVISRIELDEIIDGVSRSVRSIEHCADFCKKAMQVYSDEAGTLKACQYQLERLRRG